METPELPIELWILISTSISVAAIQWPSAYIDAGVYYVLVRTASVFKKLHVDPMAVFIRTIVGQGSIYTVLPNGEEHSINDLPAAVHSNGTMIWMRRGKHHRDGAPATVYKGAEAWAQHGEYHRNKGPNGESLPAITDDNQTEIWFRHGKPHRDNGPSGESLPAYTHKDGTVYYYQNGLLHRDNDPNGESLPAVITADGTQKWYRHGVLHRDHMPFPNGDPAADPPPPAVIYNDVISYEVWVLGVQYQSVLHGFDTQPPQGLSHHDCYCWLGGDERRRLNGIVTWNCDCDRNGAIIHDDTVDSVIIGGVIYLIEQP